MKSSFWKITREPSTFCVYYLFSQYSTRSPSSYTYRTVYYINAQIYEVFIYLFIYIKYECLAGKVADPVALFAFANPNKAGGITMQLYWGVGREGETQYFLFACLFLLVRWQQQIQRGFSLFTALLSGVEWQLYCGLHPPSPYLRVGTVWKRRIAPRLLSPLEKKFSAETISRMYRGWMEPGPFCLRRISTVAVLNWADKRCWQFRNDEAWGEISNFFFFRFFLFLTSLIREKKLLRSKIRLGLEYIR